MIDAEAIKRQLGHVLASTDFQQLGERYEGKVRDSYSLGATRFLIASDRISCFDRVVSCIPFKGQVLTQLAAWWFERAASVLPHHLLECPDPNVMVVRQCAIAPVELVVRAYLTGSAWRDYEAGRSVSGIRLPAGMRPAQKLPELIITPSTKAARGDHDEPISEVEILSRGLVNSQHWSVMREAALTLFKLAEADVAKRGLILVDTKYEFGILDDQVILADEIHTLDSSRYWVAQEYRQRFEQGSPQVMLDKEPVRQWLLTQGFRGDGPVPHFSDEYRVEIAQHYIGAFARITGEAFVPVEGDALRRIGASCQEWAKKYRGQPSPSVRPS